MFPLGSVLFPTMMLPLHLFEPRYLELADRVVNGEREFGVVLIERGSEVGGGEVRSDVGTVAQVVEAQQFDDGRWALGCVGTRRIRVLEWLADDPYPRAIVEDWVDPKPELDPDDARARAEAGLAKVFSLYGELGYRGAAQDFEISTDATMASYQISALAPLGALDRQKLLASTTPALRLELADQLLADEALMLEHRLAQGE